MTHLSLKLDVRQNLALTPRLQYAVRLLQLSSVDYEQELHEMVEKNPFLEVEDRPQSQAFSTLGSDPINTDTEPLVPGNTQQVSEEITREAGWEPVDEKPQASSSASNGGSVDDPYTSALDTMAADIGLRQHLRGQANLLPLSDRDRVLVCAVIESLDDDGYLRLDLAEIADMVRLCPPADACEMSMALKLVQSFEPTGVGARDVAECLLLQIENMESAQRDLIRLIVAEHLDRVAQRDMAGLARRLARPLAEVEAACVAMRRLDPRPGLRFGKSDVPFIKPDVVARKVRGTWTVQLNPAVVPPLKINQTYAALFQRYRKRTHGELGACLQEARWAIRNVEQRFSTILAVSQAIVERQSGFLDYGPLALKPLALRDIANDVGVHASTVCRVSHNKYLATPGRLIELKQFFSRPMAMKGGGACSPTAIRGLMQEIIAAENPQAPLSDVEIAQRLTRQGLTVARRTVTKYRQMLGVAPVEHRRMAAGQP
ncbi:MAG: RNA polymerase factor sigma-54 [Pseudomonadota bacterium]